MGVFSRTAGTRICSLGCCPGLSELAGPCAGLGPPGVCSGAEAVVTTCCCMSFCCTTCAVAVTAGIICTCCPAAVACVSVTVCGEAWQGTGSAHHQDGSGSALHEGLCLLAGWGRGGATTGPQGLRFLPSEKFLSLCNPDSTRPQSHLSHPWC